MSGPQKGRDVKSSRNPKEMQPGDGVIRRPTAAPPIRAHLMIPTALTMIVGLAVGTPSAAQAGTETCQGLTATIIGSGQADTIHGTEGDDVIWAGAGDDTVHGNGGDDVICAGKGHDVVHGGTGNDRIVGYDGNDKLYGGNGNDELSGLRGNDLVHGGRGADDLNGGPGDDRLVGGNGTDRLHGGEGTDTCKSGEKLARCESSSDTANATGSPAPHLVRPAPGFYRCSTAREYYVLASGRYFQVSQLDRIKSCPELRDLGMPQTADVDDMRQAYGLEKEKKGPIAKIGNAIKKITKVWALCEAFCPTGSAPSGTAFDSFSIGADGSTSHGNRPGNNPSNPLGDPSKPLSDTRPLGGSPSGGRPPVNDGASDSGFDDGYGGDFGGDAEGYE